jgi:Zinc knuckle
MADARNANAVAGALAAAGAVAAVPPVEGGPRAPRVGGISDGIAWTGGTNCTAGRITRYATNNARRPTVFREARGVEQALVTGLADDYRIGSSLGDLAPGRVTLTAWISNITTYMGDNGMDTVFRVYDGVSDTEVNCLTSWGTHTQEQMNDWVTQLKTGIVLPNGAVALVCQYDLDNLRWSGRAVMASLKSEFWELLRAVVPMDASGPVLFLAVIYHLQQTSAAAVRLLLKELQVLNLVQEPGQNVVSFVQKVSDKCRTIAGTGAAPPDLATMVAALFLNADVRAFDNLAITIHDQVERGPPSHDWEWVCQELTRKYLSLKGQSLWAPAEGVPRRAEALVGQLTMVQAPPAYGGGTRTTGRTCYTCGSPDHLQAACPRRMSGRQSGRGGRGRGTGGGTGGVNSRPRDGEPQTKHVDGVKWSYCGTCGRWTKGGKAHLTSEHVRRENVGVATEVTTSSANVAVAAGVLVPPSTQGAEESVAYHGGSLTLRGGMLYVGQSTSAMDMVVYTTSP